MTSKKRKKTKKGIIITLDRFKIAQIVLFFLISLSWTFILGVLTGRGYFDKYLDFFREERSNHHEKDNLAKNLIKKPLSVENSSSQEKYIFQVAAFRDKKKAIKVKDALKEYGFDSKITPIKTKEHTWYKVYVYLIGSIDKEIRLREKLKLLGLGKPVVVDKE